MRQFKLVIEKGPHEGKEFILQEGETLLGRWDPESASFPDINLEPVDDDVKVSRQHARVEVSGRNITVEDLGSLNGTQVNSATPLAPNVKCHLEIGDELIIGKTIFRLHFDKIED